MKITEGQLRRIIRKEIIKEMALARHDRVSFEEALDVQIRLMQQLLDKHRGDEDSLRTEFRALPVKLLQQTGWTPTDIASYSRIVRHAAA